MAGASNLRAIPVDEDDMTSLPPTPEPTNHTPAVVETISDGEESEAPVKPSQRMSSRKQMKQKRLHFDSSPAPAASKNSLNMAAPIQASRSSKPMPKAGFFGTQKTINVDSSDDEEEPQAVSSDEEPLLPEIPTGRQSKRKRSPSTEEEAAVSQAEDDDEEEEEEEEDAMPMTPAARRRQQRSLPKPIDVEDEQSRDSSPLLPDDDDDEDEDSDVVVTGSRTRGKRKTVSTLSDEESPAGKPRARKRLRRLNPISEEERQDIEDDLKDLASSGSDTEIRPSQKKKKNPRQEALERLKRKRGGATIDISDDEPQQKEAEDEEDNYVDEENAAMSDDEVAEDTILPPRMARRAMFNRDDEDEGFVIDDEDAPLGVPDNVPIAFTRYASMKAKELFKFAVEWMVQKKINPAFQIDDEIYDLAFKKLDDEVKGLAGSKFMSAAWTPEFTIVLQARPELESGRIDRGSADHFLRDKCDACNRSGHPATYEVRFQGRPYHSITLEPVAAKDDEDSDSESSDSDSESDEEGHRGDMDSKGRQIPSADKIYYLGKFCMRNAEVAHSLNHWRYHLYEWVVDYLNQAGYNAPEKIVKRDGWSTRKRRKYANKIVDAMETDGKIKALYKDFKNEIDSARNANTAGRFYSSP